MSLLSSIRRFQKRNTSFVFTLALLTALQPVRADILRPGGEGGGSPAVTTPGVDPVATAQAIAAGRANAGDVLARAAQSTQAVQAMQDAARALAISGPNNLGINPNNPTQQLPDVPNGLAPGGLQVDPAVAANAALWSGAHQPTQAVNGTTGHTTVTVEQTAQQALLNWRTFNIGKDTTLNFDQSAGGANAGQWIAFNFVNDPSGAPSQILGAIQAQGQVYVINQNGIIFGGSSQISAHTLVASSLPINSNLVAHGLLNNPDAQFLFSALALPAGTKGPTEGFTPPPPPAGGRIGDVTVQAGAKIEAPTTAANVGGRVMLVGPNVTNNGSISTPDGQTILAAGLQVGFVAHSSSDPSLRGLDVYVGAVVDPASLIPPYAGTVTNNGQVDAPRGSVTLTGKEVVQNGALTSTTSVALNGRIDLLANYDALTNTAYDAVLFPNNPPFLARKTGHVEIGAGSVMQILPEWASTEKVIGTELALRSQINIQGLTAHFGSNSILLAPNALVEVNAGVWEYVPGSPPQSFFVRSGGQIYLDAGAVINVAGSTDINVPVTQNLITLQLRAAELADSPLQRNGVLRGQTITVDIRETGTYNGKTWIGTPLADVSGYAALIQRSVGELTIGGGTVNLRAGGSVVMQAGSEVNTSAGWINFTGGTVATTKVITGGQIIDISQATPNLVYTGIFSAQSTLNNLTWNVSTTFYNATSPAASYEDPGHVHGADGGHLGITAPAMALDGSLLGRTITGPAQRVHGPELSQLELRFEAQQRLNNAYVETSPSPPTITFQDGVSQAAASPFALDGAGRPLPLPAARRADVFLSPDIFTTTGFGSLNVVNVEGAIVVPTGAALTTSLHGSLSFEAAGLTILGSIHAPGGSITLTARNLTPVQIQQARIDLITPPANAGRGLLVLGADARLSTAGTLMDDRVFASALGRPAYANEGGQIKLQAFNVSLATGSVLDVSGGVHMSPQGVVTFGDAGSISVSAGLDPAFKFLSGGGVSQWGASFLGYSGAEGGTLSIEVPLVQVGGTALHAKSLVLQPELFTQGGFSHYKVAGQGLLEAGEVLPGVFIAPGTTITPVTDSLALAPGPDLATVVLRKPVGLRSPMSLDFLGVGVDDITGGLLLRGGIVLAEGSVIRTDPRAAVTLNAHTVALLGSIETPGGNITIKGGQNSFQVFGVDTSALATVYLGSHAVLSAVGTRVLVPDFYNRRIGTVLAGGDVSISGNIAAAAGALIDVSGTSDILDLHPTQIDAQQTYASPGSSGLTSPLYSLQTVPVAVHSDGGSITLSGGQFLAVDATLRGAAGGATALGGSLTVSSSRFYPVGTTVFPVTDTNLLVKQSGVTIGTLFPDNASAIGRPLQGPGGAAVTGRGYFAADSFAQSGMDSLTLGGKVEFTGGVSINARGFISLAGEGMLKADGAVTLNAAAVFLGREFAPPVRVEDRPGQLPFTNVASTFGSGSVTVNARHVEAGTLSLQNIGSMTLAANEGDIVGNGILAIAGHLTLRAGQVYAPTATQFTAVAYDYVEGAVAKAGSITILASGGPRQLPLSAGSTLSLYASTINQAGVLRAPVGTINLGWDGTGTAPRELLTGSTLAFPITTQLTLAAGSVASVSAIDPISGQGVVIPYGVSFDGTSWIDPRGMDITAGGLPEKIINLSAANITHAQGATVDLRGGGDLVAYRWVQGNGGTRDILDTDGSFAVIPGYQGFVAPYASFNTNSLPTNLIQAAGAGYQNSTLQAGDRVYLAGSANLAAGFYTLLPARYALLPGAVLVTPKTADAPVGTQELPGNVSLVSGYRYNSLNSTRQLPTLTSRFEVVGQGVVNARSDYDLFYANTFLKESATRLNATVPQLPQDSGYLLFQATQSMSLLGTVSSSPLAAAGRGASIDISAPLNISITNAIGGSAPGTIFLNSAALSAFGAESLLIGGKRTRDAAGVTIGVQSTGITVDNAGGILSAKDVTLATKGVITLAAGSSVSSSGTLNAAVENFNVVGNGSMLRVSQSAAGTVTRTGTTNAAGPALNVGAGAQISGTAVTLDTTALTTLDPAALITASHYAIHSGRICLQLANPGALQASPGLVISSALLSSLQGAASLSLLSYSSVDVYGTGTVGGSSLASLNLSAGEIRGFNQAGGTALFQAKSILLNNQANVAATGAVVAATGMLTLQAETLRLGVNQVAVSQFAVTNLIGTQGVVGEGIGGLTVQGALNVQAPAIVGAAGAVRTLISSGNLALISSTGPASVVGGLGSTLGLAGANVNIGTQVRLPSGAITVRATGAGGHVTVASLLDVSGTAQTFFDVTKYTDAGEITLISDSGNVVLSSQGSINVAANSGGGNAGRLSVAAVNGSFTTSGSLFAQGGTGGRNGSFELDTFALPSLASLSASLTGAAFDLSQIIRVRTGDVVVDALVKAATFRLAADQGGISVAGNGTINASGRTGGTISLSARGSVVLNSGSQLTVAGEVFSSAGKGGEISLEAGTQLNGVASTTGSVDIQTGSTLNLSVASKIAGNESVVGSSAYNGQFSGKLHIRAPQNATFTDVLVNPINGTITGASSILVEGYRVYDLTGAAGASVIISTANQTTIRTNAQSFLGTAGTTTAGYTAMLNRLLANNAGLAGELVLAPGAEIINRTGGLALGSTSTTTAADWDLSGFRFGAKSAPGVLTLRAKDSIIFYNALSDGFTPTLASSRTQSDWLWLAPLSAQNTNLPTNTQSWSYRIVAGADMSSADFRQVLPTASLTAGAGSVIIGKNGGSMVTTVGNNGVTSAVISATSGAGRGLFQVVRTGSGDIDIHAGRSIQLANQFASIYTAGTRVQDATLGGTFDVSILSQDGGTINLGAAQQNYGMYFGMAGGNVTLTARENIERTGVASSRELPNNWLYRRGYVNSATGQFDFSSADDNAITSTAWWVDYSNFFEGVGALAGGNVSLTAGGNITNVDAVVPTNARMSKGTVANPLARNQTLLELGGGDVSVRAGGNIDAGVYYVERGRGTLYAGGQILTNASRSASALSISTGINAVQDSNTWLPTTLFVGKGGFDVSARGNVLLGPVANVFLMPQGVNNTYRLKTYFSTYAPDSYVNVSSLGGSVTLREGATISNVFQPLLLLWTQSQQVKATSSSAQYQPWLRLAETKVTPFSRVMSLMPPVLRATSFSASINLQGDITLAPAAKGSVDLLARTSINGLQPNGRYSADGNVFTAWGASTINVSDANPVSIPSLYVPFAYQNIVSSVSQSTSTRDNFLEPIDKLFRETGATTGTLIESRQALHTPGILHSGDTQPLRLYAAAGDISGLTLYAPKASQIYASRDIADVALYLQNTGPQGSSIVAGGRDIIPYNASTLLRLLAAQPGNIVVFTSSAAGNGPLAGDIQISGGGALQVLAGRNLDLGSGAARSDGTGAGITSIGNTRNPFLPFAGADIFAGAGIGAATSLTSSALNFTQFINDFVLGARGADYLREVSPDAASPLTPGAFALLSPEEQKRVALEIFYLVLRDAGRNYNNPDSPNYRKYDEGFAAIAALFPGSTWSGEISTQSREIRTKNGGDINLFAPGGGLTLASSIIGSPLTPPGIITDAGGNISIFTHTSVDLGISRIFTLKGGNEILWSSTGDIAAGSSSKTVQAAPPTRVIIDPQSADVATDLAGLATGGGIGVLASVKGVPPGSVDLIAPTGVVDAGDAGIRASGNLNIAATQVLNASNISTGGTSTGTPSASVSAPNMGAVSSAASAGAATSNVATAAQSGQNQQPAAAQQLPSIITVEVLGYGGGTDDEDEEERRRKRQRERAEQGGAE